MPSQPKPDDDKLRELVLHIARRSERDVCFGATKLNKLLFFADFLAYLRLGRSITGQEYQKLDNGPAPRKLKPLLKEMERGKAIAIQRVDFHGREQQRTIALRDPLYGKFSKEELLLVDDVIQSFWNLRADEISALSHGFVGWQAAHDRETIPYRMALIGSRQPTDEERRYGLSLAR